MSIIRSGRRGVESAAAVKQLQRQAQVLTETSEHVLTSTSHSFPSFRSSFALIFGHFDFLSHSALLQTQTERLDALRPTSALPRFTATSEHVIFVTACLRWKPARLHDTIGSAIPYVRASFALVGQSTPLSKAGLSGRVPGNAI
jgi:hypothetical protein